MSIQATCDSCGKTYSLNEKYAGKRLPCKECGETFEVQGDDDFDAPPARPRRPPGAAPRRPTGPSRPERSAPPARSSKKRGGKRRKSSGPNWLLIGLGGGGGLLLLGGLIWALMTMLGNSHESLAKEQIDIIEDLADIMSNVKDVPSAKAAVPRIERIGDRIVRAYEKEQALKKSDPITAEEEKALEEKYEQRRKDAQSRVTDAMSDLRSQPVVIAILQEPMLEISRKMMEASRAAREKNRDEYEKHLDEMRSKARPNGVEKKPSRNQNPSASNATPPAMPFPSGNAGTNPDSEGAAVFVMFPKVSNFDAIEARLREMAGQPQLFGSNETREGGYRVVIAPISDIQQFADAVDFGKVRKVDQSGRIITIEPDETYTFKPGGATP